MASGSSDAGNVCPWPASILLLEEGYLAASRNDTTARARTKDNRTVEVTFWIADPPAVSFYTFHCINSNSKDFVVDIGPCGRPRSVVAGAHGRFLLLRTFLCWYEYFIYKGHPKSPSLETIPPVPFDDKLKGAEFGIVPRGDDDGHYLLVALRVNAMVNKHYRLYIYSSEDTTWTTEELPNPCPELGKIAVNKVFTLGDGLVLFVDLLRGMLLCDLRREPHRAQYIPLPEPLPGNREKVKKYLTGARLFRDLTTSVDGRLIKFIEMEHRVVEREIVTDDVPPEKPDVDPRTKDVLYDSELISLSKQRSKPVGIKPRIQRSADGWSATMWTREIGSNFWLKGSVVDVNDILVDDSVFSALLSSNKSECESAGSLTFKDLDWVRPTLSTDGNDILYLNTFNQQLDVSVLAAVDLADKTLKKVEAPAVHNFGKYPPSQQLRPCALANQLKVTPGIKVSANLIALMGRLMDRSANEPNSTTIRVAEPDSYDSENKRPRLLAEKVNHAQPGAQSTVQNVLISQAQPNKNNMPPWLCFNRYQQPAYSGYSSWHHQNNPPPPPPPPPYFNNWAGPYNPVYAPSTPASNIQSYVNYQSLPQQPQLQEQQTTPSMAFGPHMAHPPNLHFNNWYGARGTMGIGSSRVNPYVYGDHSGSGLYHQR